MYFIGQIVHDLKHKRPCVYFGVKIMSDEEKTPVGYVVGHLQDHKLVIERGRDGKTFTHYLPNHEKGASGKIWTGEFPKHLGAGFMGYLRDDCENLPEKEMVMIATDLCEATKHVPATTD